MNHEELDRNDYSHMDDVEWDAYCLYVTRGLEGVFEYGEQLDLPWGRCEGCDTDTPTYQESCLACGQSKS